MTEPIHAITLRERGVDRYDPSSPWIVDLSPRADVVQRTYIRQWIRDNFIPRSSWGFEKWDDYVIWGTLVGFPNEYEATMFYLAHC